MSENYTVDEKGLYHTLDGNRILVSYMRGDHYPVKNPVQSRFEPAYLVKQFPGTVGVVVAFVHEGEIRYGFSKANIWRGDTFRRRLGVNVAIERAFWREIKPPFEDVTTQPDIYDALHKMHHRATSYFKYMDLPTTK